MARIDLLASLHNSSPRNYLERVTEHDKAACAEVAGRFGREYWDGDRRYGYGGYRYDGRWRPLAEQIAERYGLKAGMRVLDVGCGKAFLLYELWDLVDGLEVAGADVSEYAIANAKPEIRDFLQVAGADALPFHDGGFDLVLSLNVLHNLRLPALDRAIREMVRVGRGDAYVNVESYRDEREKVNLLYWQLTCESFFAPEEWAWLFTRCGYDGDYGFIFFE